MAPALLFLLKMAAPVVVDEVRKRIADDKPHIYETHQDVPASVVLVPAVKALVVGSAKSRTQWLGLAVLVLGFLQVNQQLITNLLPPQWVGYGIATVGALSLFLRAATGESLVEKADPKE